MKKYLVPILNYIEGKHKFPGLKKGDIAIQVGFDMSSKFKTSDIYKLLQRVGKNGIVIAIDPDPFNIVRAPKFKNLIVVECAAWQENCKMKLTIADRASHNVLQKLNPKIKGKQLEVECKTLDNIVSELDINPTEIRFVNITVNGAEMQVLSGMSSIKNAQIRIIYRPNGKMRRVRRNFLFKTNFYEIYLRKR